MNEKVDSVHQRAPDPVGVALDLGRRTAARALGVAKEAARAWVRGADEGEASGVRRASLCSDKRDRPVLKRLTEALQRGRGELRHLIQEENPVVRK